MLQSTPPSLRAEPRQPIIVEVGKQPPVAREIGMGDVVLGAVGLTGAIILAALLAGLVAGAVIIGFTRWREQRRGDHGSVRLRA